MITLTLIRTDRGLEGLTFSDRRNLATLLGNDRPLRPLNPAETAKLRRRLATWGFTLKIGRSRETLPITIVECNAALTGPDGMPLSPRRLRTA